MYTETIKLQYANSFYHIYVTCWYINAYNVDIFNNSKHYRNARNWSNSGIVRILLHSQSCGVRWNVNSGSFPIDLILYVFIYLFRNIEAYKNKYGGILKTQWSCLMYPLLICDNANQQHAQRKWFHRNCVCGEYNEVDEKNIWQAICYI